MSNMQSPNQVCLSKWIEIRDPQTRTGPRTGPWIPDWNAQMFNTFDSLQRKYLEQIEDLYCDFHITKIPLFETEVRGISRLHHMSNLLAPGNEKGWLSVKPVFIGGHMIWAIHLTKMYQVLNCNILTVRVHKSVLSNVRCKIYEFRMVGAVGTAHSCSNPNSTVWNSKGIWLTYILMILFLHFTLLSIPGNKSKDFHQNA